MARSGRGARRAMPSTPAPRAGDAEGAAAAPTDGPAAGGPDGTGDAPSATPGAVPPAGTSAGSTARTGSGEPDHLITGTGCLAGHQRGHELDSGRRGQVPTRRATRIGFFLVLWCAVGIGLVVDLGWLSLGLQLLVLWLVFTAFVQRRAGHRGRCWRTRTWRHAWGGLAPGGTGRPADRR